MRSRDAADYRLTELQIVSFGPPSIMVTLRISTPAVLNPASNNSDFSAS